MKNKTAEQINYELGIKPIKHYPVSREIEQLVNLIKDCKKCKKKIIKSLESKSKAVGQIIIFQAKDWEKIKEKWLNEDSLERGLNDAKEGRVSTINLEEL